MTSPTARHQPVRNFGGKLLVWVCLMLLPIAGCSILLRSGAPWLLGIYTLASLVSIYQYWSDKRSAEAGESRTPEKSLHWVELAGGWPGALIAQQWLRHKTRKVSYQVVFWLIVLIHQLLWADWLLLGGRYLTQHLALGVQ